MRADLYRFVAAAGRDHHLAEDIVQETILRALREQGEVRDPRAWCFTVALNLLRSHFRRRRWLPLRAAKSAHGIPPATRESINETMRSALVLTTL